jgi:lipopolysaccharide/colanic/teichoic acid biosynthesis glycosyltransferase
MVKRLVDLFVAGVALLLLTPLFLLLAIAVKLDSPGPVFFRQERVGLHGRRFRMFKFRTMSAVQSSGEPLLTVAGDQRITRVGSVLRRYKLDELPQLIDVLRGAMSLVGPRPEVPRYVDQYPERQRERVLSVRPGITDFASLKFRNENELLAEADNPEQKYLDVILPDKLRAAVNYVDHASLTTDLRVLGLTLRTVFIPPLPTLKMRRMINHAALWRPIEAWMARSHERRGRLGTLGDALVVIACWHLTYLFRLGFERWQPGRPWYDDYVSIGVVVAYLLSLQAFGVRKSMWRFFAFDDFRRLTLACATAGTVSAAVVLLMQLVGVARAVLVLHPVFTLVGLSLLRMAYRVVWEQAHSVALGDDGERRYVVVLGAGEIARRLIAGLHQRQGWHVLMLLDDNPRLHGMRIAGVPIEGPIDRVRDPGLTMGATHVVIAMPSASPEERARALELAARSGLIVLTVPDADQLDNVSPPQRGSV